MVFEKYEQMFYNYSVCVHTPCIYLRSRSAYCAAHGLMVDEWVAEIAEGHSHA